MLGNDGIANNIMSAAFSYNNWDQLSQVTVNESVYQYQYDPEGLRTKKEGTNGTVRYHMDNNGRVIAESNAGGQVTAQNICDPSIGRFISEDPYEGSADNPLSLNLYIYCSNNPVLYTDPSGLKQTLAEKYKDQNVKIIWDNKNKIARVYEANGKKIAEYKVDNKKIWIENDRVVIYSQDHTNKPMTLVDGAKFRKDFVYSLKVVPGELKKVASEPNTKQAVKNTVIAVTNAHIGLFAGIALEEVLPSSGDPEFDEAMKKINYVRILNPRAWSDSYDELDGVMKTLYFKFWGN